MARKSRKNQQNPLKKQTLSSDMKLYRTGVYARLSVEDSKNQGCDTIENQLNLVREYIESKPYLKQMAEYVDM